MDGWRSYKTVVGGDRVRRKLAKALGGRGCVDRRVKREDLGPEHHSLARAERLPQFVGAEFVEGGRIDPGRCNNARVG